jgi:hypothetical protein
VVDGGGQARADLAAARSLARQRAKRLLAAESPWADDAIRAADSQLALTAVDSRAADSRAAWHWDASGLPGLHMRIFAPLAADPPATFIAGAAREFRAVCAEIDRSSEAILAVDTAARRMSARQRRARLGALAARLLAAHAGGWSAQPAEPAQPAAGDGARYGL